MKTEITVIVVRTIGPNNLCAILANADPSYVMWERVALSRLFQCPSTVVDCLPALVSSPYSFAEVA